MTPPTEDPAITALNAAPADILKAASECADNIAAHGAPGETFRASVEAEIARAIMAERERCETATETVIRNPHTPDRNPMNALKDVLTAIRNPTPPSGD